MSRSTTHSRCGLQAGASAAALVFLLGALGSTSALAQQAGWSRNTSQGIEVGPLPVPDPGSMSSGTPNYIQSTGNDMPDPGDLAPENGQTLTIFNRSF